MQHNPLFGLGIIYYNKFKENSLSELQVIFIKKAINCFRETQIDNGSLIAQESKKYLNALLKEENENAQKELSHINKKQKTSDSFSPSHL